MSEQEYSAEILEINDGFYSLIFTEFDRFNATEHFVDGHIFSAIIEAHCNSKNIDISSVELDPESDMFTANSSDYKKLENISFCIQNLLQDTSALKRAIENLKETDESSGDLTTKEFLEILREDSLEPYIFEFNIDFYNLKQARNAFEEIKELGYKCLLEEVDGEIYFDVQVSILPEETAVLEKELEIKKLAKKYKGQYSDYGVKFNSPIEIK